jgi:hypothetical protein
MNRHKRRSVMQERRVAKDVGGRVQPGSGAPDFCKGDVRVTGELRIECKTTSKSSYSLKFADLDKISLEALEGGMEDWVMQVEFQKSAGSSKKFAVLPYSTFVEIANVALPGYQHITTFLHTENKSIKLYVDDLYSALGKALAQPGYNVWMVKLTHGVKAYALVDWDSYIYARELQPRQDQEP